MPKQPIDANSRIVIVGAGAGGLACAAALHMHGFVNVAVLEKAQAPRELEHLAPINLGANVVRAFAYLGLQDQLLERSWRWSGARIQNAKGKQLGYLDGDAIRRRSGFSPITTTRQQMLAVLRSAVPNDWLRYGTELLSVSDSRHGVSLELAGMAPEQADLLIGANGYYSSLRDLVMGKTGERKDGKLSVQALIPAADAEGALDFGQDNVFTEIVTTRGSIGFGKNTDQDFNVFFNITEDHVKDSLEAGALVDYARATFAGLDRRVDGILEVIDPANVRLYFPKDRPLSTGWSKGRVVLIGDAAHPCFQYTGLGAAMAIESALVLANALKTCRGHADAFRRFEKARLPRVKVVNAKSYQGSRLFGLKNALAATLRDLVMGLVPARLAAKPIFDIHAKEFLK